MTRHSDGLAESVLTELIEAIRSLRYGSVEITVHDGRVTQIEKREKVRFNESKSTSSKSDQTN